jgi:hypothetical protein
MHFLMIIYQCHARNDRERLNARDHQHDNPEMFAAEQIIYRKHELAYSRHTGYSFVAFICSCAVLEHGDLLLQVLREMDFRAQFRNDFHFLPCPLQRFMSQKKNSVPCRFCLLDKHVFSGFRSGYHKKSCVQPCGRQNLTH